MDEIICVPTAKKIGKKRSAMPEQYCDLAMVAIIVWNRRTSNIAPRTHFLEGGGCYGMVTRSARLLSSLSLEISEAISHSNPVSSPKRIRTWVDLAFCSMQEASLALFPPLLNHIKSRSTI